LSSPDAVAVAIDLGTTTIAASLLDLATGNRIALSGALNPQRPFGADVVSRMDAVLKSVATGREMTSLVNRTLAELTAELLQTAGISPEKLRGVAIAGNPAMEHLLLGLSVERLAFPPYRPLFSDLRMTTTAELGWELDLPVAVFPLPGGFVGGDLVAFLYGVEVVEASPEGVHRLYLDLGTNGEMALRAEDGVYATSAAAGPAFEGGNLACGMPALPGAINRIVLKEDRLELSVVGGGTPTGLCGSGVLDAVAALLDAGVLDATGRMLSPAEIPSNLGNRVEEADGQSRFLLYRDARNTVYLSQEDVRQFQLAKGAIRAGMEVLCERAGIALDAVGEIALTGSFGAELSASSLKRVGIFTENMVENALFIREGALRGVECAVSLAGGFDGVERLSGALRVVPLSGTPAFEKHFVAQMDFPAA
jgi:uncharacterized 2Fe-2S/4Fe-4S cluster protein (DUF4445 family)